MLSLKRASGRATVIFFVPPYVGYLGWVGVRLDRRLGRGKIAEAIEDAYLTVAPKRLIEATQQSVDKER